MGFSATSRILKLGLVAASLGLWLATAASALPVNHGNFSATDYDFLSVTETTQTAGDSECLFTTDDANPANGACAATPLVLGNQLLFFPSAFTSSSTGGSTDVTLSQLQTTIMSTGAAAIDAIQIDEFGDYTITGVGTAVTEAAVGMSGFATVIEANGLPIVPVVIGFVGTISPVSPFTGPGPVGPSLWSGSVTVDIASSVANATKVVLSFNNQLSTISEASTTSTIQKKVVSGPSVVISVPPAAEPGLLSVLAGGVLAVLARRSRKA